VSNDCPMARYPVVVRPFRRNGRRWSFRDFHQSVDVALTLFRRRCRRGGKRLAAVAECIGDEWKRCWSKSCHPHGEQPTTNLCPQDLTGLWNYPANIPLHRTRLTLSGGILPAQAIERHRKEGLLVSIPSFLTMRKCMRPFLLLSQTAGLMLDLLALAPACPSSLLHEM
jgi:hypothetical protein